MNTRRTTQDYTFSRPFTLGDDPELHPAGTYAVTTEDEQIDVMSRLAWRRLSTSIAIRSLSAVEHQPIAPADIEAAVARDGACVVGPPVSIR